MPILAPTFADQFHAEGKAHGWKTSTSHSKCGLVTLEAVYQGRHRIRVHVIRGEASFAFTSEWIKEDWHWYPREHYAHHSHDVEAETFNYLQETK